MINNYIKEISKNKLAINHLVLMKMNYFNKDIKVFKYEIEKNIYYAQLYNSCKSEIDVDYTIQFKEIISSDNFIELYLKAMNSPHIKNFAKQYDINLLYQTFMKDYAENINKYILYVSLTRGIKAYISNYFRIVLNTKYIKIIGEFESDSKKEFLLTAYLLIILLKQTFHFIFRLNKEGKTIANAASPERKKFKETYKEIGVDLIYYLFGTEYITFISEKNSHLICDQKSWENINTNFKVFNVVYLSTYQLCSNNDNKINENSGLKCDITEENEFNVFEELKICTNDGGLKYCF